MSLQAVYKQFLAAPNSALLASNASLNYITTLVTVNGSSEIIKHLNAQTRELTKKEEKYLGVVEGEDALAVEVQTTIEFLIGGGGYLPKLDDNFLADRVVTFPIIHIVSFDADGKIQQIRQHWDQGSLLKLIDVIGKTGRNWPIRDGKDQIKLIANSVKSTGKTLVDAPPPVEESAYNRSRGNSTHVTRDPHASLSLFAPRSTTIEEPLPSVVAPKSSAKPPPRDYNELFGGQDGHVEPLEERSESPSRAAHKIGASKNYGPSRLFETESQEKTMADQNKEKMYRPNAARYQHFDFGDAEEVEQTKKPVIDANKHSSQWNFDDFMTPQKVVPSKVLRTNEVRHWGNSDDEVVESPLKTKKVDKPRKSAETHFEFIDDGTSEGGPRIPSRPRGQGQNDGLGLYKDNLFDEETGAAKVGNESVPNLANVKDRRKDFDPHFTMTDDSPASKPAAAPVPENTKKVVKMMDANWDTYDQSPSQKENGTIVSKSISIAGDGMGGKKGPPLSEATNIMSHRNDNPRGINTAGDGMGGKKGSGRTWGFGDDSDGEEANKPKFKTGKTQGKAQATGGDFWDF